MFKGRVSRIAGGGLREYSLKGHFICWFDVVDPYAFKILGC